MNNPELRRSLIENGKSDQYRKIRNDIFSTRNQLLDELAYCSEDWCDTIYHMSRDEAFECEHIRKCAASQRQKIEEHLRFLIRGNWDVYFMTFTFNDDCLDRTKEKTRREKIARLLNKFCDDYILNIDYGKENEREHYHAVISVLDSKKKRQRIGKGRLYRFPYLDENYKYGFYTAEIVNTHEDDGKKLARYITKLTLHSVKVRQSYVSVKKGSPYQEYKKLKAQADRQKGAYGRAFTMDKDEFDEKETHLLSGFSTV